MELPLSGVRVELGVVLSWAELELNGLGGAGVELGVEFELSWS